MKFVKRSKVYHVGQLDAALRSSRTSHEGGCLSVSIHPEAWSRIARLGGGKKWALSRDNAQWLDVLSLKPEDKATISNWALDRGYAEPAMQWRVWFTNDDDEWCYFNFDNEAAARDQCSDEIDDLIEEGDTPPSINGGQLDVVERLKLTQAAMVRLERWSDPLLPDDGLAILYCQEVLKDQNPDLVGLWWNERLDPSALSAPRGAVLLDRLAEFSIADTLGNAPPNLHVGPKAEVDDFTPA